MADGQRCAHMGCESTLPALKRCTGCRKVCYCSSTCQKVHWEYHVFDCKSGKPISTVYYLASNVRLSVVPFHHQTRVDYGFDKAERILGEEGSRKLARLYTELIGRLEVPLADIRRWQKEGRLVEGVRRAFEAVSLQDRDGNYSWFLDHQYVLDDPAVDGGAAERNSPLSFTIFRNAWPYAGGSSSDTEGTIHSEIGKFSPHRYDCFMFVALLLDRRQPGPDADAYLLFGFVAVNELNVSRKYAELFSRCTFEEFFQAYETSSIPELFGRYSMVELAGDPLFQDAMSGSPTAFKSVWNLKQYIDELRFASSDQHPRLAPSVKRDYGYGNCKNAEETKLLDDLYTQLFAQCRRAGPLQLHEACLKGKLLAFAKKYAKLSPRTATYTRLLKNAYSLPECKELSLVPVARRA